MATCNYKNESGNQETASDKSKEENDDNPKAYASKREDTASAISGKTNTRSVVSACLSVRAGSDVSGQTVVGKYQLPMPSVERNKQALSDSYLSLSGFQSGDYNSEQSETDSSDESFLTCEESPDEENEGEIEIRRQNVGEICYGCKKAYATHFCKDCKDRGKYICHVCLQYHTTWTEDHNVLSLSVETERNSHLQQDTKFSSQNRSGQRFYNDPLYLDIIREQDDKSKLSRHDERLKKYGTYPIRTRAVFIDIIQLENTIIVLTDYENRELKILNHENFSVIRSEELPKNPYLTCFIEGNRVIIALKSFDFCVVDLTDRYHIENEFKIEPMLFKSIAYASNELFGCTIDTLKIYNETGQQESEFKPSGITAIEDMCVNKEGELVYCADETRGIVIIDRHGNVVGSISENIYIPQRLCLDHTGNLFVTEKESERIIKVDLSKKTSKEVGMEKQFKNHNPVAMCCEKSNNRLIIALWQGDALNVLVYTCP